MFRSCWSYSLLANFPFTFKSLTVRELNTLLDLPAKKKKFTKNEFTSWTQCRLVFFSIFFFKTISSRCERHSNKRATFMHSFEKTIEVEFLVEKTESRLLTLVIRLFHFLQPSVVGVIVCRFCFCFSFCNEMKFSFSCRCSWVQLKLQLSVLEME